MPQLDIIAFLPQIFWLFILFLFFVIYMSFSMIPKMASMVKDRENKVHFLANEINTKKDGSAYLIFEYDQSFKKAFLEINQLLDKLRYFGATWVPFFSNRINTTSFQFINQRFYYISFFKEFLK
jgi:hypothetical protein